MRRGRSGETPPPTTHGWRTSVAWLEEAVLLTREENKVQVFPSSLRVSSVEEARAKLEKARIADAYRRQLLTIAETLIEADADEGISTDELMAASGLTPEGVRGALHDMERLGIASNDTVLTAFVHAGVQRASRQRFEQAAELERGLIDLLRETAPDMEKGDTSPLHLRLATQRLKDDGHAYALPELLRRIVRSIAADGRGEGGGGGKPWSAWARCGDHAGDVATRVEGVGRTTAELRRTAAGASVGPSTRLPAVGKPRYGLAGRDDSGQAAEGHRVRLDPKEQGQGPRQADGPCPSVAARTGSHSAEQGADRYSVQP